MVKPQLEGIERARERSCRDFHVGRVDEQRPRIGESERNWTVRLLELREVETDAVPGKERRERVALLEQAPSRVPIGALAQTRPVGVAEDIGEEHVGVL